MLHLGYQRYGTLIILKHSGLLERALAPAGYTVAWSEFVAGPQLLQAVAAGVIDAGETGDAPPVFAQSMWGKRLLYIGHGAPAPHGEAILVRKASSIRSVADLKSQRLAFNHGSNVHYLALAALARTGLRIPDIHVVNLAPAAARAAFDTGRLDAWAIWDPYLAAAQATGDTRILTDATGLTANRQFLLASPEATLASGDALRILLAAQKQVEDWAAQHKDELIAALATDTGLAPDIIRTAVQRLPLGMFAITPDIITEQQKIADTLNAAGLLPSPLQIKDAVWTG
ncbi:aliphatic sulphonate ABC transporter periplasmic protein [Acetobacter oeni LMG 21952]|nr:aliphatic sulphonate ABC transporter periplasmic protein [Acetobacter oeni LMG 21952]